MENSLSQAEENLRKVYPETGAGSYSRVDGTVEFYSRINALCDEGMSVLDIGAGRGQQIIDAPTAYLKGLLTLQGKVRRVVGADIDPAVKDNPYLDDAKVIVAGEAMPFKDEEFDLVYADWVLEHVATPQEFARDIFRILKPGGWFCARTPNRWGMTGIATNLIPSKYHAKIAGKLQPGRQEIDVFPTTYLLNTKGRLSKHFRPEQWENFSYFHNAEPPYVQKSRLAIGLVNLYFRISPALLGTNLFIFLKKR